MNSFSQDFARLLLLLLLSWVRISTAAQRVLPLKVLIGYASTCGDGRVERAVHSGVNVVIWSFWNVASPPQGTVSSIRIESQLNLTCVELLIHKLDNNGYDDTIHLASIGGWNGGHLPEEFDAISIYNSWKEWSNGIFHGIDWDLEGNDFLQHHNNYFSMACLEKMGEICSLAKHDGLVVSLAPPQSYFDAGSSKFSRYINLTDPSRSWEHSDFHYFGANVYTYIYAKWADSIDFVSIQLYESYSRAMFESRSDGVVNYLVKFMQLTEWLVDFSDDPSVHFQTLSIIIPPHKLVLGVANGWADGEKSMFITPREIESAFQKLDYYFQPRGIMFWTIDLEGEYGVYMAEGLNQFLKIRKRI